MTSRHDVIEALLLKLVCMSADDVHYYSTFYGAGSHTVQATQFYEKIVDGGEEVGGMIRSVTKDLCIPLEIVEYREEKCELLTNKTCDNIVVTNRMIQQVCHVFVTIAHGGKPETVDIVRGGTFANIQAEISNPEDLEPPATCSYGAMVSHLRNVSTKYSLFLAFLSFLAG